MSDEINPNAEIGGEENVDAGFGEGLSFDDVEGLTVDESPAEAKSEPAEDLDAKAASEEDVENTEEREASNEDVPTQEEVKLLKAMMGENEYDLPEDAMFTQKVNGVEEQVSIKDLLTDYSGKTDWNRKYSELGEERQSLKKEQATFNDRINTFVEKAKESKIDALAYLAETSGADPVAFIKEFKQGIIPELEEYMNMSETEKELYNHKQELEILKKSQDTKVEMERRAQERTELETSIQSQIEDLGIEQTEYVAAYDRLIEAGIMEQSDVTPEAVSDWVRLEQRVAYVDDALANISPELADDVALIEDLVRTSHEGGLSQEATIEVINELYGQPSKEAQSVSKKVRQASPNLKQVTNSVTKSDDDGVGPISFDDL